MQITRFSDLALRTLIHLAAMRGARCSAREIAEQQRVSFNHLAKIAQWLAAEGYVDAIRGRGGGMTLAMAPSEIFLGPLLRKSEAGSALVECFREDGGGCVLTPCCGLRSILLDAQEAFFQVLDERTLGDVLSAKSSIVTLLRRLQPPRSHVD